MWKAKVLAIGFMLLVAACAAEMASPSDEEVLKDFVAAMNRGDREAALGLLADEVESHDDGALLDEPAKRAYLAKLPDCEVAFESMEAVGDDLIVAVNFGERDGESCPGHRAGETGRWVMRVEDGRITVVP